MIRRGPLVATVASAALVGLALAGCGTAKPADNLSPSSSAPTKTYAPGGLTSTSLVMTDPGAKGGSATITGILLNNGAAGDIVSATAPVATGSVLRNGTSKVSGIPVPPNGAKPSVTLTSTGYNIELTGIDMSIDPDGQITLYLVTSAKQESQLQVKVK
ncbi:MAG: hypothetical protein V9E85_14500 [Candidatus Nanopelagicales bacterium]